MFMARASKGGKKDLQAFMREKLQKTKIASESLATAYKTPSKDCRVLAYCVICDLLSEMLAVVFIPFILEISEYLLSISNKLVFAFCQDSFYASVISNVHLLHFFQRQVSYDKLNSISSPLSESKAIEILFHDDDRAIRISIYLNSKVTRIIDLKTCDSVYKFCSF
jgi:hypothetical protein